MIFNCLLTIDDPFFKLESTPKSYTYSLEPLWTYLCFEFWQNARLIPYFSVLIKIFFDMITDTPVPFIF